jgi:diaminopimelate decarboxylase
MHRFHYRGRELYCEEVAVAKIARAVGTPFYLYSVRTFLDHYQRLKEAFGPLEPLICFSVKANSNLTILKALVRRGAGLDIVSGGELFRARKTGVDPQKIVYASVGKTEAEIETAIRAKILMFNVESLQELDVINSAACKLKTTQKIAIRVNPDVAADTHHYIRTGSKENKFGLDLDTAYKLFMESYRYPFLRFAGIHMHIGSQITRSRPFVQAIRKCLNLVDSVSYAGNSVEYLNIGGGLGIIYSKERPMTAEQFARVIAPLFKKYGWLKIILEPGRFVSGNGGILVTRVLYEKKSGEKSFAIVDAGMNDLIRPAFYGAHHEILPVIKSRRKTSQYVTTDVVGPICESGDFLAKDRRMLPVRPHELLAVMSCGAYGFVMSSNYNSRPRVPEVVVKGTRFAVSRCRETAADLIRGERIVRWAV